MGKRVFMVINGNFPRMGAGTNYIHLNFSRVLALG